MTKTFFEFVQKGYDKKYIEQLINKKAIGLIIKLIKNLKKNFLKLS